MLAHAHFVYNKNICNFLLQQEPIDVHTVQQNAVKFNWVKRLASASW